MRFRSIAFLVTCIAAAGAEAASWQPVPGVAELDVDLASVRQDGSRVMVWLRGWDRTVRQVEFDCARRSAQVLSTTTYNARGAAVSMSSVPGPKVKVVDGDLGWTYDAMCEAARATARF